MKLCPRCTKNPKIPGYGYCRDCRNAYMRDFRARAPKPDSTTHGLWCCKKWAYRQGTKFEGACHVCARTDVEAHTSDVLIVTAGRRARDPNTLVLLCVDHHRLMHSVEGGIPIVRPE